MKITEDNNYLKEYNMELKEYSIETLINHLRERGVDIKKSKSIKLKPYFGEVDDKVCVDIDKWEGHYGLNKHGVVWLCTPDGKRIPFASVLTVNEDGRIYRSSRFRDDTPIPVDINKRVIIK